MRTILPVILVVTAGFVPAFSGNVQRADAFLRKGTKALEAGEIDDAAALFEKARSADPALPQPEIMLGQIHMSRGEFDEAEGCFERAIELHRSLKAHLRRAVARSALDAADNRGPSGDGLARGRPEQGVTGDLQAQAEQMRADQAADRKGGLERREGHSDDEPDVPADMFVFLGNARVRAGRPAEAAAAYREAVARDPDAPESRHNLAVALAQSGQLHEALENCRLAEGMDYQPSVALCPQIETALQPPD